MTKVRNVKKSSWIKGITYENKVLGVATISGKIYYYQGVPREVAARFHNAKSYGKFFNQHIAGQYETVAVAEVANA